MLKLPKNVAELPNLAAVETYFAKGSTLISPHHEVRGSQLALDDALTHALKVALGTGHLVQGLELIAKDLDREAKGIKAVQEKSGQAPAGRLSRLIFLANDGSERFLREAAGMLGRHADRAWGCLIKASSDELGRSFTTKGGPAKALMIDDKAALGMFLTALAQKL